MNTNIIHLADCVEGMNSLPEKSIDVVVTSPPYNLNINYGKYHDSLPRESYLQWLNDVFVTMKRCLKDDGHLFLNVGYSNIDPWVGMDVAQVARNTFTLQNNFMWVKSIYVDGKTSGHFKPINSDRFANPTWEHLFHFTKSGKVKCDKLAVGVPYEYECNLNTDTRARGKQVQKMGFDNWKDFQSRSTEAQRLELNRWMSERPKKEKPKVRCKGNTWFVPYDTITDRVKDRGKHPATFPVSLVEHCIKFSGVTSGVLMDPFMGSGTSAIGALNQSLEYVGYDIDEDYIEFAEDRIRSAFGIMSPEFLSA